MPHLAIRVTLRMIRWHAILLGVIALPVGLVLGVGLAFGDDSAWIALGLPLIALWWALMFATVAGVAHGVALLPVVLRRPRSPLPYVRVLATLTSIALVLLVKQQTGITTLGAFPYVVLTPFLAARGYVAATSRAPGGSRPPRPAPGR